MYNYIIGKVADKSENSIVVENGGIGYELGVSGNTLDNASVGDTIKIYTYLYVREDVFALYGFLKREEKNLFLRLIDISGVGPKMAMQILGGYDLKTLSVAIASGDSKTLCKIKGLGKKTAELIILNLRDSVADDIAIVDTDSGAGIADKDLGDAIFALESLGISRTDAVKAASEAAKVAVGAENIIAYALKQLV